MIEELFDSAFNEMIDNDNPDNKFRLFAKAMFVFGFGDCYSYMMKIIKDGCSTTDLLNIAETGIEINKIIIQMGKEGVVMANESNKDPTQSEG